MKINFSSVWLQQQNLWRLLLIGTCATAIVSTGCSKHKSSNQTTTEQTNQPVAVATHEPVYAPRSVATAPVVTPSGEPDMGELNRCLLRWVLGHRRKPANFDEFAATANVAIPPAPAGKKYAIDSSMHIVLVKQ